MKKNKINKFVKKISQFRPFGMFIKKQKAEASISHQVMYKTLNHEYISITVNITFTNKGSSFIKIKPGSFTTMCIEKDATNAGTFKIMNCGNEIKLHEIYKLEHTYGFKLFPGRTKLFKIDFTLPFSMGLCFNSYFFGKNKTWQKKGYFEMPTAPEKDGN